MSEKEKMKIMCIPVKYLSSPPVEQTNCIIENCPDCNEEMWVSEKKRNMRKQHGNRCALKCGICHVKDAMVEGYSAEDIISIDINELH